MNCCISVDAHVRLSSAEPVAHGQTESRCVMHVMKCPVMYSECEHSETDFPRIASITVLDGVTVHVLSLERKEVVV